ncbi:MAG: hypothetical protein WC120_03470 [Parcubacteria group bacterium]
MEVNSSILVKKTLRNKTAITLVAMVDRIFADIHAQNIPLTEEEGSIFLDAILFHSHDLWPKYPPQRKTLKS